MTKVPSWQKRYRRVFERYVDTETGEPIDEEFGEDLRELRELSKKIDITAMPHGDNPFSHLSRFLRKYYLHEGAYKFMQVYVMENRIDYSLITSGLFIVSGFDGTALAEVDGDEDQGLEDYYNKPTSRLDRELERRWELRLVINSSSTINEIVEFVRSNKEFIKEKQGMSRLDKLDGSRIRQRPNQLRDTEVRRLNDLGLTHKEIALRLNAKDEKSALSYTDVATILHRIKER